LAVLSTIAVFAKLSGQSHIHALTGWATAWVDELAAVLGVSRARMSHPTTWTCIFGYGVTAAAVEAALQSFMSSRADECD
jgi:hypothetical protein